MHLRLPIQALAALSLLLAGCDSGDPSVSRVNSFGDGTESDIRDEGSGLRCKSTQNLDDNQLLVSVQTPSSSPEADPDRGLANTTDASLRVESTRESTSYEFSTRTAGEDLVLTFPDGIPDDVDVVISASIGGDDYRAPIASSCDHVFVNPFSERLVEEVVEELSDAEIESINDCTTSVCPYLLRWEPLVDQVQTFEVDAQTLPERADFEAFLERSRELLTREPADFVSNDDGQINLAFNTVQYGVSLNQDLEDNNGAFWATHTIDRGENTANDGTSFAYPLLTLSGINLSTDDEDFTDEFLNFDFSAAQIDVPYERNSADFSQLDSVFSSYSTNSNRLYRQPNDNLISLRRLLQTVDDSNDGRTVGWTPNPHLFEAGVSGDDTEDPDALLSGYFHGARGIQLSGSSGDGFEREQLLEEQAIAGIELNLAEWESDQSFSADDDYWFAGFEIKADGVNDFEFARASIGEWEAVDERGGTESIETGAMWELDGNGEVLTSTDDSISSPYEGFDLREANREQSSNDQGEFLGNLHLNYGNANQEGKGEARSGDIPNGAASPDSNWLAFSSRSQPFDNDNAGDILRVARAQSSSAASPDTSTPYRLSGFSVEVTGDGEHRLIQREQSCATFGSSSAEFQLDGHRTQYTIDTDEFRIADSQQLSASGCTNSDAGGLFEIGGCSNGPDFEARGYATDEGDTLVMITRTDQSVGFLLGFRDDSVEGCSG